MRAVLTRSPPDLDGDFLLTNRQNAGS